MASQQKTNGGAESDWAQIRDEWLNDLDCLYRKVAELLKDYVPGSINFGFTKIELNEDNIGDYMANQMDIAIGRQRVSLIPIATMLVGCKGRVDAEGSAGRAQILLVNEKARTAADLVKVTVKLEGNPPGAAPEAKPISWAWKIVTNTFPKRFVDLDKESFFALLMEIANA